ncbi:FMN-binding split barrel [Stachybotrys elegans]|uniref:FMN-binding split barrel n=1 Tax=Stachybotrys elegans TaxID=80388 RepID=A0A8K0SYJ1_9HYPO|nr:FMN-binding split barrel [Stachybotrys elegans]
MSRPDFKTVEASRPEWNPSSSFHYTQTVTPGWKVGDGANHLYDEAAAAKKHIPIDPQEQGRPAVSNYKLLISGITPRPIAFLSTRSADGKTTNLAPFSYFNVLSHDPPLFVVSFSSGTGVSKDSLRNLLESKECVINIISEHYIEAANSTSINAPYGVSEWEVSGLTPEYDCETVKCARVKESVFSIEAKLDSYKEYESRANPGRISSTVVTVEGTRFWVREDALNEEKNTIDPTVLRPMGRLGGITYGRCIEAMELPRPDFEKDLGGQEAYEKLAKKSS